jgi:hypothetical protein
MASAKVILYTHKKLKDGNYPVVLQLIKDRKSGKNAQKNQSRPE